MLGRRKPSPPDHDPTWPPVELYRAAGQHLRSAGGAYVVLPYGLLAQLDFEDQASLVGLLKKIARANPAWSRDLAYEVRAWEKVRPGDLPEEALAGHGITTDVDAAGEIGFHREGSPVPQDVVLGHRPIADPSPVLPGTRPGARPHQLPDTTSGAGSDGQFRRRRAERLALTRQRRADIAAYAGHHLDSAWAWAIAGEDNLWGPDEQWKTLLDSEDRDEVTADDHDATPEAAAAAPAEAAASGANDGLRVGDHSSGDSKNLDGHGTQRPEAPAKSVAEREISDDEMFLRQLEADLQDLF